MKQNWYGNFWELMADNRSLRKINVSKTEVTDKVCSKINSFLQQQDLRLGEFGVNTEAFDPIQLFKEFQKDYQNEVNVIINIENAEAIPKRIIGEKKRFLYIASKLLRNSIFRGNIRTRDAEAEVMVQFSFVIGNLSE